MGEGPQDQPGNEAISRQAAEFAALSARVTALEGQIASLHSLLSPEARRNPAVEPMLAAAPASDPVVPLVAESSSPPSLPSFATAPVPRESLEKRLGSQVFSRVGIIVVLIAAALFLKLAIDNQWIGPTGRVLAGLIGGSALVLWSERFRRKGYSAFSYTLKAVGSGVLYLSLWAAFQIYHLLPAGAAFTAMVLVTAWNAYMAWAQNAEGMAAYALIGGFATPLLLSTGGNHEKFLFAYILAIDVATVALVRLRPWSRLLLAVFPATVGFFIGWYAEYYRAEYLAITSIFIAMFFFAFAGVPLRTSSANEGTEELPPLPERKPKRRTSVITEVLLPLANAAFGSLAFYSVLQDSGMHSSLPWMVVLFAAIYLGLMRLPQSAAASAVHLSLAIVFLTIAVPLKASGHWITVSWLVEGTALLWVAARLAAGPVKDDSPVEAFRVLRNLAIGALMLGFGGLLTRIYGYGYNTLPAFWNHRFATALVGIAAFSLTAWIAFRARQNEVGEDDSPASAATLEREQHLWLKIGGTAIIAINLVAILSSVREIAALWPATTTNPEAELQKALAVSAFLMVYGGALLAIGFWKRTAFIRWQALLLIVFTIAKTFIYDMRSLSQGYRVASFMALGVLLLAVSFAYQNNWLALRNSETSQPKESQ